jgi:hypothetical protein
MLKMLSSAGSDKNSEIIDGSSGIYSWDGSHGSKIVSSCVDTCAIVEIVTSLLWNLVMWVFKSCCLLKTLEQFRQLIEIADIFYCLLLI